MERLVTSKDPADLIRGTQHIPGLRAEKNLGLLPRSKFLLTKSTESPEVDVLLTGQASHAPEVDHSPIQTWWASLSALDATQGLVDEHWLDSGWMDLAWLNTAAVVAAPASAALPGATLSESLSAWSWPKAFMAMDSVAGPSLLMGGLALSSASSIAHAADGVPPDIVAPKFLAAVTSSNGLKVVMAYDETLSQATAPKDAYSVKVAGVARSITAATVVGKTIELTLASPVLNGETVMVTYTDPSSADDALAIQDAAGNDAASFSAAATVFNLVPDTTAPVAPMARLDGVWTTNPQVTMKVNLGAGTPQDVVTELFPNAAPLTVSNWLAYVNTDFYNGLVFHRVIPGFVVQAGGYTADLTRKAAAYSPLALETSASGLSNLTGTLAMARTAIPDSATSEFYVNLVDNTSLDYASASAPGYVVFGDVVSGMATLNAIATVPTTTTSGLQDVPTSAVTLTDVSVTNAGQAYSSSGTIYLSGLEAGATWSYSVDGGNVWLTLSQAQINLGSTTGAKSVLVRQTDSAGNVSPTTLVNFIQYQADASQSLLDLATASDTAGGSAGTDHDNITQSTQLHLSAVLASWANKDVWLMDQGKLVGRATADAAGALSWQVTGASTGDHLYSLLDPVHQVRILGDTGIAGSELLVRVI